MANYPVSLDTITNPTSGNTLDNPSHSLQHSDANDILEALETKVGIGASPAGSATSGHALVASTGGTTSWTTIGTAGLNSGTALSTTYMRANGSGGVIFDNDAWTAYTPTWTNLTIGNGTNDFKYKQIGKLVIVSGIMTFGSTTSVTGSIRLSLPVTASSGISVNTSLGNAVLRDAGTATNYGPIFLASTTVIEILTYNASTTYLSTSSTSSTVPFTWTTSDQIAIHLIYEGA